MKKAIPLKQYLLVFSGLLFLTAMPVYVFGEESDGSDTGSQTPGSESNALLGPDAVENRLREDSESKSDFFDRNLFEPLDQWKKSLYDKAGLKIGADYNSIYFTATDSPGDDQAGSGVARLYGSWELTGRGTPDTGSLVFKFEHRHKYTDIPASDFGFELGYAGLTASTFSDQGFRTTNLYWRQSLFNSKVVSYIGFMDVTDYVNIYALASPWTSFSNLVFATGSATIGGLPDGALGAMAAVWVTDNLYVIGGLADANSDPTDVFEGFDTFFDEFETFKSLDLVWTPQKDRLFADNILLTVWQKDRQEEAGVPGGWGVSFSMTGAVNDKWLPFIRGGWADDGGSILEASISAGLGYQRAPGGDVFGVGLNWGRPNSDTFGTDLDNQFTTEVFYRWQIADHVQVTPSVQFLGNPALNPDDNFIAVFGLRARLVF